MCHARGREHAAVFAVAQTFGLVYGNSGKRNGSETIHTEMRLRVHVIPQSSQDGMVVPLEVQCAAAVHVQSG